MEFVLETLSADLESLLRFAPRLLYGLIVLAIFVGLANVTRRLVARLLQRSERFHGNTLYIQRLAGWAIGLIGLLFALSVMGFGGVAASMLATGGIVAIVLGFAFKEIGENFLAGFFLTFSRPFEIGDLIETGEFTGTVKSIDLRNIHLRTFDASDLFVPSAQIYRDPLINYTRDGLRRPAFKIGVSFADDPQEILAMLEQACGSVPDVLKQPESFVTISEFDASYIVYKVFFYIDVTKSKRGYVGTLNDVMIACWRVLLEAGVTFSADATTALDVKTVPGLTVQLDDSASR